MNNTIPPVFATMLNGSPVGSTLNNQGDQPQNPVQQTTVPQQDKFVKSNTKIAGATAGGTAAGGIVGFLKEKFKPKAIPKEITDKFDSSKLNVFDSAVDNKASAILKEDALTLRSAASKLLNGTELSKDEIQFLNSSRIILPDDVKFLASNESNFMKFVENYILGGDISSNPRGYFTDMAIGYPGSGLVGNLSTWMDTKDRIDDFLNNGGKYSDNEEFLDYMTSRIYKDAMFKVAKNEKNNAMKYVTSDTLKEALPEGFTILSEETYTYKDMVKHAKEHGKTYYMNVATSFAPEVPVDEYIASVGNRALQQAKTELEQAKDIAINKFHNKQLLKSAGIGALAIGILTLGGNLIYNKVKKDKQSDQAV